MRIIPRKRPKYGNSKSVVDGFTFDSQAEARRWVLLKALQRHGHIRKLERQVKYLLAVNGVKIGDYIADFRYIDVKRQVEIVEDVKGVKTPVYRLKKKLVRALYDIDIAEVAA